MAMAMQPLRSLRRLCAADAGKARFGSSASASAGAGGPAAGDHFDYLVIGGGSGGVSSARRAAQYGARVAVVERGPDRDLSGTRQGGGFGGTCVNMGCVPKKLMFTAGSHVEAAEEAAGYGVAMHPAVDWAVLVSRRDGYVERLNGIYESNLDNDGIHHVRGRATFVGPREVRVGGRILSADHVLIAVGGKPALPTIPGAELCTTSDGFFDLQEQPKNVLVVGAGYIAVELAGILNALGLSLCSHPSRRHAGHHHQPLRVTPPPCLPACVPACVRTPQAPTSPWPAAARKACFARASTP